jgi:hypothetical protein
VRGLVHLILSLAHLVSSGMTASRSVTFWYETSALAYTIEVLTHHSAWGRRNLFQYLTCIYVETKDQRRSDSKLESQRNWETEDLGRSIARGIRSCHSLELDAKYSREQELIRSLQS